MKKRCESARIPSFEDEPGVAGGDNITIELDEDNEPQPDGALFVHPDFGGRAELNEGYLCGSPEMILEVSASTAGVDLNRKLKVYRRNQVSEYVVWRVYDEAIDWFNLRNGQFERLDSLQTRQMAFSKASRIPACGSIPRRSCRGISPPFWRC